MVTKRSYILKQTCSFQHVWLSEKLRFLTPWYAHVRKKCSFFGKFSVYALNLIWISSYNSYKSTFFCLHSVLQMTSWNKHKNLTRTQFVLKVPDGNKNYFSGNLVYLFQKLIYLRSELKIWLHINAPCAKHMRVWFQICNIRRLLSKP